MKRKALGKGLRSLIPEAPPKTPKTKKAPAEAATATATAAPAAAEEAPASAPGLREIDLDLIRPNRRQPRQDFDDEALQNLAASIKRDGILQPVVVRPVAEGRFELIAGERRWRAAQLAELMRIPVVIKEVPDDRLLEVALVENIQREELNPIEEALGYQTLMQDFGLTQQEIAKRVGKQRSTVANSLRLLALPRTVQRRVRQGELSMGHARALLGVPRPGQQAELADQVVKQGLSVRQVEKLVARMSETDGSSTEKIETPAGRDPNVVAAEEELQRSLGTKVKVVLNAKGAGRIELHAYSQEEMQRIFDALMKVRVSS